MPTIDKSDRLAVVYRYELPDTPPDTAFDRIKKRASRFARKDVARETLSTGAESPLNDLLKGSFS